jgi:tripartite-type tricarboxylate transporter receptor subunit TctC
MSKLFRLAVAAAVALTAPAAAAQSFPSRPVQLIVPFPPGGTTDILAREVAQQLSARWNVAVVVENKAGASGAIGSEQLIRSAPDGHTLMITATHHVINPSLRKLPYDTRKDFSSIAQVATVPNVLVVHPSVPATDVQELIRLAREKPGSLSFGSTGVGGANHLSGELFKSMAGVDMVHIPYKGAAPALNDLLGGQIPVMFDSLPGVIQHLKSGKLRALGVTTARRVASMPEIPTIGEAGVPGFEATAWFGLYGPANLPPDVLARIVADVDAVLQSERTRERFTPQGAEVIPMTQPEFARFVDAEIDKWAEVVDRAGLKPQ